MKKEEVKTAAQLEEEAFREKVGHYLMCFIDQCPLHTRCLRWLVGQYAETTPLAYNAINPRNPSIGGEHCSMFREKVKVVMKRGFRDLYHEMPTYKERHIRRLLIQIWGRKQYFEMRRGDRLITPDQQDDLVRACRHCGWQGPVEFEGEQEDYLW